MEFVFLCFAFEFVGVVNLRFPFRFFGVLDFYLVGSGGLCIYFVFFGLLWIGFEFVGVDALWISCARWSYRFRIGWVLVFGFLWFGFEFVGVPWFAFVSFRISVGVAELWFSCGHWSYRFRFGWF